MTDGRPRHTPAVIAGRRIDAIQLQGDERLSPIVLLHEGLGSVELWRDFPLALRRATGRRVIAFSRFGHGRSQTSPWPRDVIGHHHREALTLLPALLAALDVREPILVGHSDGASIALIYAGHHPVSGLVLLAPHVFVEPLTLDSIRATRDEYLRGQLRERMRAITTTSTLRSGAGATSGFTGTSAPGTSRPTPRWSRSRRC